MIRHQSPSPLDPNHVQQYIIYSATRIRDALYHLTIEHLSQTLFLKTRPCLSLECLSSFRRDSNVPQDFIMSPFNNVTQSTTYLVFTQSLSGQIGTAGKLLAVLSHDSPCRPSKRKTPIPQKTSIPPHIAAGI